MPEMLGPFALGRVPKTNHCNQCGADKPATDFFRRNGKPGGLRSACKDCEIEQHRKYVANGENRSRLSVQRAALRAANPEAYRAASRNWRKRNPERTKEYARRYRDKIRENRFRREYHITTADYDRMFAEQKGRCAVCGDGHNHGRRLSVDHDHSTGKARALLCIKCNTILGLAADNEARLKAAIEYLGRFGVVTP